MIIINIQDTLFVNFSSYIKQTERRHFVQNRTKYRLFNVYLTTTFKTQAFHSPCEFVNTKS